MLENDIGKRPIDLWEYYSNTVQKPRPITNKTAFYAALMKQGTAKVNKDGVHFLKRIYFVDKEVSPCFPQTRNPKNEMRFSKKCKYPIQKSQKKNRNYCNGKLLFSAK